VTDRTENRQDEEFARAARELMRGSAEYLDAATRSRLNRARQKALDELDTANRRGWSVMTRWVPAGAALATAVLAVSLWVGQPAVQPTGNDAAAVFAAADTLAEDTIDLELLLADESLEMIEDLEFFAWLDADLSTEELQAELGATG